MSMFYLLVFVLGAVETGVVLRINSIANKSYIDSIRLSSSSSQNELNIGLGLTDVDQKRQQLKPVTPPVVRLPVLEVTPRTTEEDDLSQEFQRSVIRLLNNQHEYEKGIHALHEMVEVLKADISTLRMKVDLLNPTISTTNQIFPTNSIIKRTDIHLSNHLVNELPKLIHNLTSIAREHEHRMVSVDRRYKYLSQQMKVMLDDLGKKANQLFYEVDTVRQFANKQRDINTDLQRKFQRFEKKIEKKNFQLLAQADAPHQSLDDKEVYCPIDYVRHYSSCYKFVNVTYNWIDAEKYCQKSHHRSHLVSVETTLEENFLVHYRTYNNLHWSSRYIWIGANDMAHEGHWTWLATEYGLEYTNWRRGQPDNRNGDEHCVYLRTNGTDSHWEDWHCYAAKLNFVCEIIVQ